MPDDLNQLSTLRVWLVHDWLTGMRGGEKVLLELLRMMPQSRIATLLHIPGSTSPEIDQRVARTSFLQHMPGVKKRYRHYLPLFPAAIRRLKLDASCDLVISSSHAVAKNVHVPAGVPHLCYCHTPMRYIWGLEGHYVKRRSLSGMALRLVRNSLRRADLRGVGGVTRFVANSQTVAQRIHAIYGREATVVHPGIDEQFWQPAAAPEIARPLDDFFLVVSALVPYKRIDLAIEAARITGQKLVIVGQGPQQHRLKTLAAAAPNISFLGWQPDEKIRDLYRQCIAFLFPGEEDFGLTPVEAQACGRPVIAFAKGGATETVITGTGIFFDRQNPAALASAMQAVERHEWNPAAIRAQALRFTWSQFRSGIAREIQTLLAYGTPRL